VLCDGCQNPAAYILRYAQGACECDKCGDVGLPYLPDVYLDDKPVESLVDDNGRPPVFSSRREKAMWLNKRGYSEAGDRVHGASALFDVVGMDKRKKNRQEVREAVGKAMWEVAQKIRR